MGILVVKSDFVGKFDLVKSITDKIDQFISDYEEKYLRNMLGKELFDLFKADVDTATRIPLTQIYLDIYRPLQVDVLCGSSQSFGMKDMILGLIWWEYVRNDQRKQSINGTVSNQTEVSTTVDPSFAYRVYNSSVDSWNAIRTYCSENFEDYPTLKGNKLRYSSWV